MPHDKNGTLLAVGDDVVIAGKVLEINSTDEQYCNITMEIDPMPPYTEPYRLGSINAKQVEKREKT